MLLDADVCESFDQDCRAYLSALPTLLVEGLEGKFAVVQSGRLQDVLLTREAAYGFAYKTYSGGPFIVKQILRSDMEPADDTGVCRS